MKNHGKEILAFFKSKSRGIYLLFTGAVITAALIPGISCKDENPVDESPSNIVFPASNVSYGAHVQPLFDQACAYAGCHDNGQHQSILTLTSYAGVMSGQALVVIPGKPDQSTLTLRIEGRVGTQMPLNRNPLNQNQITGIRAWIGEGAKNN
jgi:hypothetical protein